MLQFALHEKTAKHTYEAKCGRSKLRRRLEHETLAEIDLSGDRSILKVRRIRMYNDEEKYYKTSSKDMINEKDIWEKVIPNSISLIQFFEKVEVDNYFLAKYINVLNGARNLFDSLNEYKTFVEQCRINKTVDNYTFHRLFKRFMGDADSVLDYLDKLFKDLKKVDHKFIFNRKNDDTINFSNKVSDIRNSMLHEGVPTMYTDERTSYSNNGCHANTAGFSTITSSVFVTINFRDKAESSFDALNLVETYYLEISRLTKQLTQQMLDENKTIESKLSK
jgi:hypothetical protein